MLKKIFWAVSIVALIYVLVCESSNIDISSTQDKRSPANAEEDFAARDTVFQFIVDHCKHSVSSVRSFSGGERDSLLNEMKNIKKSKGTSIENKNNVFYPLNNCISVFISNTLLGAEGARKSVL